MKKRRSSSAPQVMASLGPTPTELINFCRDMGLDVLGAGLRARIAQSTPEDYSTLVKDLFRADSMEDKLRLALNWWTVVHHAAASVIEEVCTPNELAGDARLNVRWRRSSKVPTPQCVKDEAGLQWEIACNEGAQISVAAARKMTRFKTEGGMQEALREFGCPSKLTGRLTVYAVKQLRWLDKKWGRFQSKKRSAKRRFSKSPKKKSA